MDEGGVISGEVCTRLMLTVLTGWVQSGGGGDRLRHLATLHTSHQTPTRPGPASAHTVPVRLSHIHHHLEHDFTQICGKVECV